MFSLQKWVLVCQIYCGLKHRERLPEWPQLIRLLEPFAERLWFLNRPYVGLERKAETHTQPGLCLQTPVHSINHWQAIWKSKVKQGQIPNLCSYLHYSPTVWPKANDLNLPRTGRRFGRKWRFTAKEYRVSFGGGVGGDEKCSKIDCDGCTTPNTLNATELYTSRKKKKKMTEPL